MAPVTIASIDVLNAFRHHRGRHSADPRVVSPDVVQCSTPFGITEVGTVMASRSSGLEIIGAQRLSASQRSARRRCRTVVRIAAIDVLNAFRHHRGRHSTVGGSFLGHVVVLNAFRHHRGRHARPARRGPRRRVLNAFRHHRGRHSLRYEMRELVSPRAQRLSASQRSAPDEPPH